jgi:hypothetical protein
MSNKLKQKVIEFKCDEIGLSYQVIGLDKKNKTGLILWSNLPTNFPRTDKEILDNKYKLLPEILKITSEADHTPDPKEIVRFIEGSFYVGLSQHITNENVKEKATQAAFGKFREIRNSKIALSCLLKLNHQYIHKDPKFKVLYAKCITTFFLETNFKNGLRDIEYYNDKSQKRLPGDSSSHKYGKTSMPEHNENKTIMRQAILVSLYQSFQDLLETKDIPSILHHIDRDKVKENLKKILSQNLIASEIYKTHFMVEGLPDDYIKKAKDLLESTYKDRATFNMLLIQLSILNIIEELENNLYSAGFFPEKATEKLEKGIVSIESAEILLTQVALVYKDAEEPLAKIRELSVLVTKMKETIILEKSRKSRESKDNTESRQTDTVRLNVTPQLDPQSSLQNQSLFSHPASPYSSELSSSHRIAPGSST